MLQNAIQIHMIFFKKKITPKINIKCTRYGCLGIHSETVGDSKSLSLIARGNSMKTTEMSYIHLYSCNKDNGYC